MTKEDRILVRSLMSNGFEFVNGMALINDHDPIPVSKLEFLLDEVETALNELENGNGNTNGSRSLCSSES